MNVAVPLESVVAVALWLPIVSLSGTFAIGVWLKVSVSVAVYVFPQSKFVPEVLLSSVIAVGAFAMVNGSQAPVLEL